MTCFIVWELYKKLEYKWIKLLNLVRIPWLTTCGSLSIFHSYCVGDTVWENLIFSSSTEAFLITQWNCTSICSCSAIKTNQWLGGGVERAYGYAKSCSGWSHWSRCSLPRGFCQEHTVTQPTSIVPGHSYQQPWWFSTARLPSRKGPPVHSKLSSKCWALWQQLRQYFSWVYFACDPSSSGWSRGFHLQLGITDATT